MLVSNVSELWLWRLIERQYGNKSLLETYVIITSREAKCNEAGEERIKNL